MRNELDGIKAMMNGLSKMKRERMNEKLVKKWLIIFWNIAPVFFVEKISIKIIEKSGVKQQNVFKWAWNS